MGAPRIEMTSGGFGVIRHNLEDKLRETAAELFPADRVDAWMTTANPLLDNEIPTVLAKSKTGFLRAEALLKAFSMERGEM